MCTLYNNVHMYLRKCVFCREHPAKGEASANAARAAAARQGRVERSAAVHKDGSPSPSACQVLRERTMLPVELAAEEITSKETEGGFLADTGSRKHIKSTETLFASFYPSPSLRNLK